MKPVKTVTRPVTLNTRIEWTASGFISRDFFCASLWSSYLHGLQRSRAKTLSFGDQWRNPASGHHGRIRRSSWRVSWGGWCSPSPMMTMFGVRYSTKPAKPSWRLKRWSLMAAMTSRSSIVKFLSISYAPSRRRSWGILLCFLLARSELSDSV